MLKRQKTRVVESVRSPIILNQGGLTGCKAA